MGKKTLLQTLTEPTNTFHVKPWREILTENPPREAKGSNIMPKALADTKAKEFNAARKKAAAKGVTKPKHVPSPAKLAGGEAAPGVQAIWPVMKSGIDKIADNVFKSELPTTNPQEESEMSEDVNTQAGEPTETKQDKAARIAQEKIAAKEAKLAEKAKRDAEKEEAKKAKAAEREAAQAKAKAEREAKAAEKQAELAEANKDGKRTYFGSMLTLADRVKSGAYVKGLNGQLRSDDGVAQALEAVEPANVVKLIKEVLLVTEDKYAHLNVGQQSMNWRNKLRGAIRADEGAGQILVPGTETQPPVRATLARLIELRDAGGYATAEAKITAAKEAREKAKAEREAARKAKEEAKLKQVASGEQAPGDAPKEDEPTGQSAPV